AGAGASGPRSGEGSGGRVAGSPVGGSALGRSRPRRAITLQGSGMRRTGHVVEIQRAKERLAASGGGYEVVHESPGLEVGVYVLVAPEPDRQQPHEDDEIYVVLAGRWALEVEGELMEMHEGEATFVPAGADHRFVGYEQLSVLVIFEKAQLA